MKLFVSVVAVLGLALSACAHSGAEYTDGNKTETKESKAEARRSAKEDKIRARAAFELNCPEEQVEVVQLEKGNMMKPSTYGATGCDKRATYLEHMGTIMAQ